MTQYYLILLNIQSFKVSLTCDIFACLKQLEIALFHTYDILSKVYAAIKHNNVQKFYWPTLQQFLSIHS